MKAIWKMPLKVNLKATSPRGARLVVISCSGSCVTPVNRPMMVVITMEMSTGPRT